MSLGAILISDERTRQIVVEGWSYSHDDEHQDGELLKAAICYLNAANRNHRPSCPPTWPWDASWWKPKDRISNLVRAGALIAAEIDRLKRI